MDSIKKVIDACRLHYEKLLLTLVLLMLAGAVWYLKNLKADEEEKIQQFLQNIERGKGGLVKAVDLSANEAAQKLLTNPPPMNFSLPHHLFNPVKWQRRPPPDNTLIKVVTGDEVGWAQVRATRITPLNFIIALDRVPTPGSY